MFWLDQEIEKWQAKLTESAVCTGDDVEELKQHLCEEMAELEESGLSQAEAFLIADMRLGDSGRIDEEFITADPALGITHRLAWTARYVGIMAPAIGLCAFVAMVVAPKAHAMWQAAGPKMAEVEWIMATVIHVAEAGWIIILAVLGVLIVLGAVKTRLSRWHDATATTLAFAFNTVSMAWLCGVSIVLAIVAPALMG
jgi:hypothetical protein